MLSGGEGCEFLSHKEALLETAAKYSASLDRMKVAPKRKDTIVLQEAKKKKTVVSELHNDTRHARILLQYYHERRQSAKIDQEHG